MPLSHANSNPSSADYEEEPILISHEMTHEELLKAAQQLQARSNAARSQLQAARRQLEDEDVSEQPNPKRRRTGGCDLPPSEDPADDDDDDNNSSPTSPSRAALHFVERMGHKYALIHSIWVRNGYELLDAAFDNSYNPQDRFENEETQSQAQLQEIMGLVRDRYEAGVLTQGWFRKAFFFGLNTQRYNMSTRLRHQCADVLTVSQTDLMSADKRKNFRDRIGWIPNEFGGGSYSSVDVPILHGVYAGEFDIKTAFRSKILMGIYVALIRGPSAAISFMDGVVVHPQTETMARIHGIRSITPGAIALSSILARWALSVDESLTEVGSQTGIHYFKDYEEYLEILETGCRKKKKSVLAIIRAWDSAIFPDTGNSLGDRNGKDDKRRFKRALEQIENDDEDDGMTNMYE